MPSRWPMHALTLILICASGCASTKSNNSSREFNFIDDFPAPVESPDESVRDARWAASSFQSNGVAIQLRADSSIDDDLPNKRAIQQSTDKHQASGTIDTVAFEELPVASLTQPGSGNRTVGVWNTLLTDQANFYTREQLSLLVPVSGIATTLAHTSFDEQFAESYQENVRSPFTDDIAEFAKEFGEQWTVVPVYVSASLIGRAGIGDPRIQTWGDRSFRSMLVGVPPLLLAQRAIGSSRPNDVMPSSNWHFWNDNNGASGHAFVGAVPFLVAAQLAERKVCRASLYAMSTLTGWSRINDNDHFSSQVLMGWFIAYAATASVERTDQKQFRLVPVADGNGARGIGITKRY